MFSAVGVALGKMVPLTFTVNATFTPPTSSIASAVGYGGRGQNATSSQSYIYETQTVYQTRRSDNARVVAAQSRYLITFNNNSSYCNPATNTPNDPTYSSNQICYTYDGFFTSSGSPATAGTPATAFGKSFPGSTGTAAQTTTTYNDIPVNAGTPYNIVVPAGGTLTITYYQP